MVDRACSIDWWYDKIYIRSDDGLDTDNLIRITQRQGNLWNDNRWEVPERHFPFVFPFSGWPLKLCLWEAEAVALFESNLEEADFVQDGGL